MSNSQWGHNVHDATSRFASSESTNEGGHGSTPTGGGGGGGNDMTEIEKRVQNLESQVGSIRDTAQWLRDNFNEIKGKVDSLPTTLTIVGLNVALLVLVGTVIGITARFVGGGG